VRGLGGGGVTTTTGLGGGGGGGATTTGLGGGGATTTGSGMHPAHASKTAGTASFQYFMIILLLFYLSPAISPVV